MLTVKQAAGRLYVSVQTVYGLCAAGRLRHCRIGLGCGAIRINEAAVAEFLREAEVAPAPPRPAAAARGQFKHVRIPG